MRRRKKEATVGMDQIRKWILERDEVILKRRNAKTLEEVIRLSPELLALNKKLGI